jgi:hypothetical protein
MARRTAALLALLVLVGGIASAQQPAPKKKATGRKPAVAKTKATARRPARPINRRPTRPIKPPVPKVGASASLEVTVDLNQIVNDITNTIGAMKDRAAWVKALMEQTRSKTGGDYNVMVFNMQQNYDFNPPPHTFKFVKAEFNGGLAGNITYGVWVFRSGVVFNNNGDGGFINWAFSGVFTRNRKTVTFQARPRTRAPLRRGK